MAGHDSQNNRTEIWDRQTAQMDCDSDIRGACKGVCAVGSPSESI
jgi:hypothetical protein